MDNYHHFKVWRFETFTLYQWATVGSHTSKLAFCATPKIWKIPIIGSKSKLLQTYWPIIQQFSKKGLPENPKKPQRTGSFGCLFGLSLVPAGRYSHVHWETGLHTAMLCWFISPPAGAWRNCVAHKLSIDWVTTGPEWAWSLLAWPGWHVFLDY